MTVDRKVNNSGLLIESGVITIKFFPTAHYGQSKSVAVAAKTKRPRTRYYPTLASPSFIKQS